jgi:hypothetical protein
VRAKGCAKRRHHRCVKRRTRTVMTTHQTRRVDAHLQRPRPLLESYGPDEGRRPADLVGLLDGGSGAALLGRPPQAG